MGETFQGDLSAARAAGPGPLMELWRKLRSAGTPSPEVATAVAEALIAMARQSDALTVLETAGEGVRARQLKALALARVRRTEEAIQLLVKLRDEGHLDIETGGILGGCYKRLGLETDNDIQLQAAYDVYLQTYEAFPDAPDRYYPGINAASLALTLGQKDESARIAAEVLSQVDLPPDQMDGWKFATRGEAHLLLGDLPNARIWYRRAVATNPNDAGSIAAMRLQARKNLRELGLDEHALDNVLAVRSVVAFSGHMIDAPGRDAARFPPDAEAAVRRAIQAKLKELRAGFGFSSAAQGSDVLFLEELLNRGGSPHVFLPFSYDRFIETSVGPDWKKRVEQIKADPRVSWEELPDPADGEGLEARYLACEEAIAKAAIGFAEGLGEKPTLLAVWDGRAGDGPGGTADAVRLWKEQDYPVEVIAPVAPAAAPTESATAVAAPATRDLTGVDPAGGPVEATFSYANRHCLCIGIGEYQHAPWRPLANPRRDAEAVGRVLAEHHGFSEPLYLLDGEATRKAISVGIAGDLQLRAGPDDLVIVFFAGHGHIKKVDGQDRGYIVPVEAEGDEPQSLVSIDNLATWTAYLECRHVLYVVDSCFSGMFQRVTDGEPMPPDPDRVRLAISSGRPDQPVYDGGGEDGHSVFATFLLKALREGISREGAEWPDFTAVELYSFLRRTVSEKFHDQTPTLKQLPNHDGGEIWFQRR